MDKTLHLCFICDENYVLPTCVALKSIQINSFKSTKYHVHILMKNTSKEAEKKLKSMENPNMKISILNDYPLNVDEAKINIERHVSKTAIYKFFIPDIFSHLNKILYLDSDILIQQDLTSLYDTDLKDTYVGVVKDIMTIYGVHTHLKKLNFTGEAYFNSGMILMNLKKMREDNIPQKLINYRLNKWNHFMDQDAFNMVLNGKVTFLPLKYNLLNCFFRFLPIKKLQKFYQEKFPITITGNYKKAVVLHLGGKEKPWLYDLGWLTILYLKYADMIGWHINRKELMPDKSKIQKRFKYRLIYKLTFGTISRKYKQKYKESFQ